MEKWYYAEDNEQVGPVSREELLKLINEDKINGNDLIWTEGMTEWRKVRKIETFQALFNNYTRETNNTQNEQKRLTRLVEGIYFWPVVIVVSVIISIIYVGSNNIIFIIMGAVEIIIISGILSFLVYGFIYLFKKMKGLNRQRYKRTFFIVWVIVVILEFFGKININ